MKKTLVRRIALALLVCMMLPSLIGCGSQGANSSGESPEEVFVKIGTGNTGGIYYPVGVAMGQLFSDNIPGVVSSAMATSGTVDNIEMLRSGEIQLATCIEDISKKAYYGEGQYEGNACNKFKVLAVLWPNVQQVVAQKGIHSIEQLEGKRIIVGAAQSGTEVNCYEVLSTLGIHFRESDGDQVNSTPIYLSYNEGVDVMKNKQADAAWSNSLPPASAVMDMMSTGDFEIIGLTQEQQDAVCAHESHSYFPYTMPANSYPNQPEDLLLVSTNNVLLVSADLDDGTVYEMTKAIFENVPTLAAAHSAAGLLSLGSAVVGTTIPFHDGAIRYFTEQGVWNQ